VTLGYGSQAVTGCQESKKGCGGQPIEKWRVYAASTDPTPVAA